MSRIRKYEGACGEIVEVTKDALTVKTGVGRAYYPRASDGRKEKDAH